MSTVQEAFTDVLQPLPVLIASAFLQVLSWSRIKKKPLASRISPSCESLELAEGLTGLNKWNIIYEDL